MNASDLRDQVNKAHTFLSGNPPIFIEDDEGRVFPAKSLYVGKDKIIISTHPHPEPCRGCYETCSPEIRARTAELNKPVVE